MVMAICGGKLGYRMFVFARCVFAGDRVGAMQGALVGAVVRQSVAVSRHGAARTSRRAATAQSRTRTRAASAHMSAPAGTAAAAATARVAAARACSSAGR
jgi:hypothetical protein